MSLHSREATLERRTVAVAREKGVSLDDEQRERRDRLTAEYEPEVGGSHLVFVAGEVDAAKGGGRGQLGAGGEGKGATNR
jgi:hypothetical protein